MTPLLELAALCEAAEGADRELDAGIAVAALGYERDGRAGYETDLYHKGERYSIREPDYYDLEGQNCQLPAYTASLDAAMTLLPQTAVNHDLFSYGAGGTKWGFSFMDTAQLMGRRAAKEQIARLRKSIGHSIRGEPRVMLEKAIAEHFVEFYCRCAATPALALCAAALRARAQPQSGTSS